MAESTYYKRQFEALVAYFRSPVVRGMDGLVREGQGITYTQAKRLVEKGIAEFVGEPYVSSRRYHWALRDKQPE